MLGAGLAAAGCQTCTQHKNGGAAAGGEIMAMLEISMMGKLPYTVLRDGIFAHPTLAESLNNLFSSFEE